VKTNTERLYEMNATATKSRRKALSSLSGNSPKITLEVIDPETAEAWLGRNTRNRPMRSRKVATLAAAIGRGEWVVNGDMIRFDVAGVLIDGQHRLQAIVEAGVAVQSYVMRNAPHEVQATLDTGARRNYGDILTLRGEVNAVALAAAVRWVWRIRNGQIRSLNREATFGELDALLAENPEIRDSVRLIQRVTRTVPMPRALAGALHWLLSSIDDAEAEFFFGRLADGVNMDEFSPIYRLRNQLFEWAKGRNDVPQFVVYTYTVKAWNYHRQAMPVKLLLWRGSGRTQEALPVPR
jgi:hypothetical protein